VMLDLFGFYFATAGYLSAQFFGSFWICSGLLWAFYITFNAGMYQWFNVPQTSLSPPFLNFTLDFHYPLIFEVFALLSAILVKYATKINHKYENKGPLETVHSIGSFLVGLLVFAAMIVSLYLYAPVQVYGYPFNYLIPLLVLSLIGGVYYYVCRRSILLRIEHTDTHGIYDDLYPLCYGRSVDELYLRFFYGWVGIVIICLCQFFQNLAILAPTQEIYAQYITIPFLAGYIVYVTFMVRRNPLDFIHIKQMETPGFGYEKVDECDQDNEDPCPDGGKDTDFQVGDEESVEVVVEVLPIPPNITTDESGTKAGGGGARRGKGHKNKND